jgi:hypothetical protein
MEYILSKPWPAAEEQGLEVPTMKTQDDCLVRMILLFPSTEFRPLLRSAPNGNMGTLCFGHALMSHTLATYTPISSPLSSRTCSAIL